MLKSKRKDSLKKHKDKAWNEFSRFIRLRDCLKTTGTIDQGICCTCNKLVNFKDSQASHFIPGRHNAVLFSEKGVNLACYACNISKHGNIHAYWLWMEKHYGRRTIDRLLSESKQTVIYKSHDYDLIADKYKRLAQELLDSD